MKGTQKKLTCPKCGKIFTAWRPEVLPGAAVKCYFCGNQFQDEAAKRPPLTPPTPAPPAPAPPAAAAAAPAPPAADPAAAATPAPPAADPATPAPPDDSTKAQTQ